MATELFERKILSSGVQYSSLPSSYVLPESERPNLSEVSDSDDVPVVDLGCGDRTLIVKQIGEACRVYGVFQAVNHGVPEEVMDGMLKVSKEFFDLPVEEKLKLYSEDPSKTTRFATSINYAKETVHNWRDFLRLHCNPLENFINEWPSNPPSFKDIVSKYCKEVRELNFKLQEAISESLGLEKGFIRSALGEPEQHMVINYYPPCPQPELTYGLPAHKDHNALTILLPNSDVPGLQVYQDGKWMSIKPRPHTFVINVADQLQAMTNGKYKSVLHRAVVSCKARVSVASIMTPSFETVVKAPEALKEKGSPAIYRDFTYGEYFKKFWSRSWEDGQCLELFEN